MQRGLLRWMLSLHQPEYRIELSPKKLPDPTEDPQKAQDAPKSKPTKAKGIPASSNKMDIDSDQETELDADELPGSNGLPDATASRRRRQDPDRAPTTSVLPAATTTTSDVPSTPLRRNNKKNPAGAALTPGSLGLPSMPPPLTSPKHSRARQTPHHLRPSPQA